MKTRTFRSLALLLLSVALLLSTACSTNTVEAPASAESVPVEVSAPEGPAESAKESVIEAAPDVPSVQENEASVEEIMAEPDGPLAFSLDELILIEANPDFHFHSAIQSGGMPTMDFEGFKTWLSENQPDLYATYQDTALGMADIAPGTDLGLVFTQFLDSTGGPMGGPGQSQPGEAAPIENDYYISKYMVTCAQYQTFILATGHDAPSYWNGTDYPEGKADHPVLYVSYNDALAYCQWLSEENPDWIFRLPTEEEWENAAYAPSIPGHETYTYPWGETSGLSYADGVLTNEYDLNCNTALALEMLDPEGPYGPDYPLTYVRDVMSGATTTIGELIQIDAEGGVQIWADHSSGQGIIFTDLFESINATGGTTVPVYEGYCNDYGLYGMAGNAWAWTSSQITATNGAEAGQLVRAVRGGSWYATVRSCSAETRGEGRADNAAVNTVGFRVAADVN